MMPDYIEKCARTIFKSYGNNIYKTECLLDGGMLSSKVKLMNNFKDQITFLFLNIPHKMSTYLIWYGSFNNR